MKAVRDYITVKHWLERLAPSTQIVQHNLFKQFFIWVRANGGKYADSTPDDLIEFQKQTDNGNQYELLDTLVQPYVRQKKGTFNSKNTRYHNIRSFFLHNRAELPRDPSFNINPEKPPNQGTLTIDEIKQVILSCSPTYQALFLSMFQGAMDQETCTYWNLNGWDSLQEQLKSDPEVLKIDLPGRKSKKNKTPYYTFIGKDSINKIKTWLKHREQYIKDGKLEADSKIIFCTTHGDPISKRTMRSYWLKHLRLLGIVEPIKRGTRSSKTGKGLHEIRDVFRSLWSMSPASHTVGEYCMGHTIDKLEYDKSFRNIDYYKSEYKKAAPFLNIISHGEAFGQVPSSDVESLRRQLDEAKKGQNTRVSDLESEIKEMKKQQDELMKLLYKHLPRE